MIRLPFKTPVEYTSLILGDFYGPAARMLQRMEAKFAKELMLKGAYIVFMNEYEALGHMIPALRLPIQNNLNECYFLPHHAVWKESN